MLLGVCQEQTLTTLKDEPMHEACHEGHVAEYPGKDSCLMLFEQETLRVVPLAQW